MQFTPSLRCLSNLFSFSCLLSTLNQKIKSILGALQRQHPPCNSFVGLETSRMTKCWCFGDLEELRQVWRGNLTSDSPIWVLLVLLGATGRSIVWVSAVTVEHYPAALSGGFCGNLSHSWSHRIELSLSDSSTELKVQQSTAKWEPKTGKKCCIICCFFITFFAHYLMVSLPCCKLSLSGQCIIKNVITWLPWTLIATEPAVSGVSLL